MKSLCRIVLLPLLFAAGAPLPALADPESCDNPLPHVLDLEAFRLQLWRAASGDRAAGGTEPEYRLVLASHLSTTGFQDPLLDNGPLAGREAEPGSPGGPWRATG
jgi:hypothetical protein